MSSELQTQDTLRELTVAELDDVSGGGWTVALFSPQTNVGANVALVGQSNIGLLAYQKNKAYTAQGNFQSNYIG